MPSERQVMFWLAALAVIVLLLWLLSPILLPFVAGAAIAYLLTPVTDRLQKLGVNRLIAALLMITLVVMAIVVVILLIAPILVGQMSSFVDNIPGYVTRLQSLLSDPSRPWVHKLLGASFSADKSMGDLVSQGLGWLSTFVQSLWSGGRSLVSLFSLVVVTPVVAFYLVYDWHRMIRTADSWVPVNQRETVRQLAREIDAAISGFVRGQTAVCLILGSFYAVALTLSGLNFGLLIGLISGRDHLHSLCRLDDRLDPRARRRGRAVLAGLQFDSDGARHFPGRPVRRGQFAGAQARRRERRPASGLADFRAARLRLSVRLRRPDGRGAARRHHRRARALCVAALPAKLALYRRAARMTAGSLSPRQLVLALDHATSFAREDFLRGPSNAAALALIERWPDWPDRIVALIGPEGSGKSHLAASLGGIRGRARAVGAIA